MPPDIKWKWRRIFGVLLFFYFVYKMIDFLGVLYINYIHDSPLDFVELMREKNPRQFFADFVKFKNEFIPFDFHKIAIENEKLISEKRKEFIRQTGRIYGSISK